ncbi:MAG: rhodanese-like domain-containing protein [Anaerolineae bacterium]
MTRRSRKRSTGQSGQTILFAGIGLLVVAGIALMTLLGGSTPQTVAQPVSRIQPQEYVSTFEDNPDHILVDVRTPEEFASGHIPGAINIPVEEIANRLDEIPADTNVVVYCRSGNRSATAASELAESGYASIYDLGGIISWQAAGLPVE